MKIVQKFIADISWETLIETGLRILMILVIAWIAVKVIQKILHRLEDRLTEDSSQAGEPPTESQKRIETIVRLTRKTFS